MKCPHCGKQTAEIAFKCVHCSKVVKSFKNRSELVPVDCPVCKVSTTLENIAGIDLDLCSSCSGIWFDNGEMETFERAMADAVASEQIFGALKGLDRGVSTRDKTTYVSCPVCKEPMRVRNYSEISGIMIDRCSRHGTWTDHDDIMRIAKIIVSGEREELLEKFSRDQKQQYKDRIAQLERSVRQNEAEIRSVRRFAWGHAVLDFFGFM